jgi:hypothetical protein
MKTVETKLDFKILPAISDKPANNENEGKLSNGSQEKSLKRKSNCKNPHDIVKMKKKN